MSNDISAIEESANTQKHSNCWRLINTISGRKQSQSGILEGKDKRERIQNWFDHFQQLLGKEPIIIDENETIQTVFHDLYFKTGEFTIDEYQKAKDRVSLNKAPGPDNIPPEVIKKCDLNDILLNFSNILLLNHDKPAQWSTRNIIPVPKKGENHDQLIVSGRKEQRIIRTRTF